MVATPDFNIDLAAKRVITDDGEIRLTPTGGTSSRRSSTQGRLVSQRQLLQEVWGPGYCNETNYVRVYMAQLRRKVEPDASRPRHLITEPGMGYRFPVDVT